MPICITCNTKAAGFNYPNETQRLYCKDRKKCDMVDVKNKKCVICKLKQSHFNYPNEKQPLSCKCCKLDGMVDIMSKRCIVCELKIPTLNYPNETQNNIANIVKNVVWLILKMKSVSHVT